MPTQTMTTQVQTCDDCNQAYPLQDTLPHPTHDEKRICKSCHDEYVTCEDCSRPLHSRESHIGNDKTLCPSCFYNSYFCCNACTTIYDRDECSTCDECDRDFCESCYSEFHEHDNDDNDHPGVLRRADEATNAYIATEHGTTLQSSRVFGVEIEAHYPNSAALQFIADNTDRALGISTDGSLGTQGIEYQTPRLAGNTGEQFIANLCTELNTKGFRVSRSCGLHVHLDGAGYTSAEEWQRVRTLWLFYLVFEDVLLSFLPKTRRQNRFCKAIQRYFHLNEIACATSREQLEHIWYRVTDEQALNTRKRYKDDNSRYVGINLHSFFHAGHLEIRYHSGTLNAQKIVQWVNLHACILDRIESGAIDHSQIMDASYALTLPDKHTAFSTLVALPETAYRYFRARVKKFNPDIASFVGNQETTVCAE